MMDKNWICRELKIKKNQNADLQKIKEKTGVPVSTHIRMAICRYLEQEKLKWNALLESVTTVTHLLPMGNICLKPNGKPEPWFRFCLKPNYKSVSERVNSSLRNEHLSFFEEYCKHRWNIERRQAYLLMEAATVAENLNIPHGGYLPQTEWQTRPLTRLEPVLQREAWE